MSASVKTSEEGRGRSSVDVLNYHLSKSLKLVLVLMLVFVLMLMEMMEMMLASMSHFEFHCLDDNTVEDELGISVNMGKHIRKHCQRHNSPKG